MRRFNIYKILFVLWLGLIFILSSIPNLKSDIPGFDDFILRKMAHFIEYFVLMFLCLKAFYKNIKDIKIDNKLIFCFVFCSLYALSDEVHQLFIATRKFAWFDWGIDNGGLVICLVMIFLLKKKNLKIQI